MIVGRRQQGQVDAFHGPSLRSSSVLTVTATSLQLQLDYHKRERESMMGIETVLVTRETGYTSAPHTGSYDFAAAPE